MPTQHRLLGLSGGAVDTVTHEIQFELTVAGAPPISFVTEFGPATQLIAGLSRMFLELRQVLHAARGMKSVAAEKIASSHIQRDRWEGMVIMQLTTPQGVPYTFQMSPEDAAGIADQLKTESVRTGKPGNA
jgi:hypothetical protein